MLPALAVVAGAHVLVMAWLATQASILKFRAAFVPDRAAVLVELRRPPSAATHPRPPIKPPVALPQPQLLPEPLPSGPATIDQGPGTSDRSNLAQPVFLDWPHPTPPGVDWGRAAPTPQLAALGGWSDCRHKDDRQEDAWASARKVKAPCLQR